MVFQTPDPGSASSFVLIVLAILIMFVGGVFTATQSLGGNARRRAIIAGVGCVAWMVLITAIVKSGFIKEQPMPRLMILFAAINIAAILLALSRVGGWLAAGLPLATLVAFQGFRLPLEFVLHSWAGQGVIPTTMTWTGQNFDIISGLAAVVLAPVVYMNRSLAVGAAWVANVVGLVLLLNVARVAIFSSPLPFAWDVQPPLQLAFHVPYVWIASVCVAGALSGHVILTRALLAQPRT